MGININRKKKNTRRRTSTLYYRNNVEFATPPSFAKEGKGETMKRKNEKQKDEEKR
jgi:hypothetical protein